MQPQLLLLKAYIVKMSKVSFKKKNKKQEESAAEWGRRGLFSVNTTLCVCRNKRAQRGGLVMYVMGV